MDAVDQEVDADRPSCDMPVLAHVSPQLRPRVSPVHSETLNWFSSTSHSESTSGCMVTIVDTNDPPSAYMCPIASKFISASVETERGLD